MVFVSPTFSNSRLFIYLLPSYCILLFLISCIFQNSLTCSYVLEVEEDSCSGSVEPEGEHMDVATSGSSSNSSSSGGGGSNAMNFYSLATGERTLSVTGLHDT